MIQVGLGVAVGAAPAVAAGAPVINPNLLTKTEQFNNTVWVKVTTTVTADATTDPLGGSVADEIISLIASTSSISQISGTSAASGSAIQNRVPTAAWTRFSVTATLDTGAFTFSIWLLDPLANGSIVQLKIDVVGGFVRCSLRDGGDALDYFAWGAKLETGSAPTGIASTYGAVA